MTDLTEPAPAEASGPTHRRAVWTTIVASQLVIALVTASAVFLVHRSWNDRIGEGDRVDHRVEEVLPDGVAEDAPDKPLNILLMGSDKRTGKGNGIDGENADGSERSDTVILLHVSQDRTSAYGVSMPRDAIVDRPDCTVDGETIDGADGVRFNTAFEVGGPVCTLQTVEELTGIHVHHFIVLDFQGFKEMVDAIGGVEVCIPTEVEDYEHNIFFDAGTQTLAGQDALNYVRERSQLSVNADIGRMKRQQAFIASMINKVASAGTLSQPKRIVDFVNAVTDSIRVDDGLDSVGALVGLANEVRNTGLDQIKFITVPVVPDPENPEATLLWAESADDLWERIKQDEKLGKDFSAGSIAADDEVGTEEEGDDADVSGAGSETKADRAAERRAAGLCA